MSKTMMSRKILSWPALALAGLLGAPAAALAQEPVTLSTGWVLAGDSAPLILAEKNGYFQQGGVKIDIVRGYGSADVVTKVAAGTYQAGTGYLPALVQAIAKDPNFDAIAVLISFDSSADAVTGPKATGITKPSDLAGRKISVQPNSTSKLIFQPFAKAVGIDPASVQWVEVSPDLIGVTVKQGQSDGAAQFAATASANFAKLGYAPGDLYQFKFSDHVENLYGNALILKKSWAAAHPEAAKGVVRAYAKGLIDAKKDPKAAIDALMAREPLLTRASEEISLAYSNENYFFTKRVLDKGIGYHSAADVDKFIALLAQPFNLQRVPAAKDVYTDAYLPKLEDRQLR
jgi:NitT/TauT family transport system substrate-binding protein